MDLKNYITAERGRAATLAAIINVSPSYLSQLISGASAISPERCVEIERATDGAVTRKDLRPDDWQKIWPELDPAHRRATDPAPPAGHAGRQPPSPHNILDSIPEHGIVDPGQVKPP